MDAIQNPIPTQLAMPKMMFGRDARLMHPLNCTPYSVADISGREARDQVPPALTNPYPQQI